MRSFFLFTFAVALAGQAIAVTVQFGGKLGNITALSLFDFTNHTTFRPVAQCMSQCSNATSVIQRCTDDTCTCTDNVGAVMLNCEQCLFTNVVNENVRVPDPRIGSQSALDGFVAACKADPLNITIKPLKMVVPPSWDGPQSNELSRGGAVVAVGAGAILGIGSLFLLTNLE